MFRHLTAFSVLLLLASLTSAAEELRSETIATVNGRPLTSAELQLDFYLQQLPPQAGDDARRQLVERLIDRELVRQFLDRQKVKVDEEELTRQLQAAQQLAQQRNDSLESVLTKLNLTEDSLRESLKFPLRWKQYVGTVLSEQQLIEDWQAHQQQLDGTRVQAAQIVRLVSPDADPAEWQQAEDFLANLREQIASGQLSWNEAAKRYSQSPSGQKGGALGNFEYGERVSEPIARVAFELQPGEISQPFRTRTAVHLLKVEKRIAGQLNAEDARAELIERFSRRLWNDVVARERKSSRIENVEQFETRLPTTEP